LVLRVETQHTIQQITNVSDEAIAEAMAALERKEKKRK
jgi:beta-lactam-binding protein with PASTA domain